MDRLLGSAGMGNPMGGQALAGVLDTVRKNGHSITIYFLGRESTASGRVEEIHADEGWFMIKKEIFSGEYSYSIINLCSVQEIVIL